MIEPQQTIQVAQAGPQFINWSINIYDLIVLIVAAVVLYGRMVKIETQIAPIVEWWNEMVASEHRIGRRWSDAGVGGVPPVGKVGM